MIVYIDSANFSTATTVYLDSLLTTVAPDGYYSSQGYYRKQVNGKLVDILLCPEIDTVSVTKNEITGTTFNGNFISNGGDASAVRGFVYGTSPSPTTADNVVTDTVRAEGTYSLNATIPIPEVTYYVRAYAIVFGETIYGDELTFTTSYCVNWTAENNANIKMSTQGYIDFTGILAGRTIAIASCEGNITEYTIPGVPTPYTCSIPMDFTTSKAQWDTDLLPAVTDTVLNSLKYTVYVEFTDSSYYEIINEQTYGTVTPGGLTSEYNDCI